MAPGGYNRRGSAARDARAFWESPMTDPTRSLLGAPSWRPSRAARRAARRAALTSVAALAGAVWLAPPASAQAQQQRTRPPIAQAWIDVATHGGDFAGGMAGSMAGGGGVGGMLGGLLGGGRGGNNQFGYTRFGPGGRFVDVSVLTRNNPNLAEAQQAIPAGMQLGPQLKLVAPVEKLDPAPKDDDSPTPREEPERPKGRMLIYWGCGDTVRPGQPRIIDFAKLMSNPAEIGRLMVSRSSTTRGALALRGQPVWPHREDPRDVPASASLVGEHAFTGNGIPEGFRFTLGANQDLMPAIQLTQREVDGGFQLEWQPIATARGWFLSAFSGKGDDMIVWSSSESVDLGFGLIEYQTNAAIDRWVNEKLVLPPSTTRCAVPKGIFSGDPAMLRMIAYGSESFFVHPPRPADPKVPWEPVWQAKVRVKSDWGGMLGTSAMAGGRGRGAPPPAAPPPPAAGGQGPAPSPEDSGNPVGGAVNILRGIFGR